MNENVLTLEEIWMLHEHERNDAKAFQNRELHQVTARIGSVSYQTLLKLAEHWDIPKSALVAEIVEAGLRQFSDALEANAKAAAK